MDPFTMMAVGSAIYGLNNAMSEVHADSAMRREKALMRDQSALNRSNALDAYRTQVEGAKMAGLNPAMMQNVSPVAPTVSQGQGPKAENVEFDPASVLMMAQAENVEANTAKTEAETDKIKGVDTENTKADTALKVAQRLYVGANQSKIMAETTQINNVNKVFQEENSAMSLFGQTMAQGWQQETWYSKLPKGSQMVIDDIAKGNFDLTVGFVNALDRSISVDGNMNAVETEKAQYALSRAVIESQMKKPNVIEALSKLPQAQYDEVVAQASKLGAETKMLRFDYDWKKEQKEVWQKNDPDKLYADYQKNPTVENAAKWLVSSIRNTGVDVAKSAVPAAVHGSMLGKAMEKAQHSTTTSSHSITPPIHGADGTIVRPGTSTTSTWSNTRMFR